MTGFLLMVIAFPILVAVLVTSLLKEDNKKLPDPNPIPTRFRRAIRAIPILCPAHLALHQKNQVVLIDAKRCKICIDEKNKV